MYKNNNTFNTLIKIFTFLTFIVSASSCSRNKKDSELFFIQGNVAYKKGDYNKAIEYFTEAIEKTPEFADAYNNRGTARLALEDTDGAIADFEKAISLDSDFILAKYNLAEILSNTDRLDESFSLLNTIQKNYKDSSFYFVTLSNILILKNKFPEATQALQKALVLDKNNDKALTNLGVVKYQEQNFKEAKMYFEKAITLNPKQDYALNNLSMVYAQEDNYNKALELVDQALALKKSPLYENNKAYYLLNTNELANGKDIILKLLEKNPNNAWALRNMGVYELLNKNFPKALENLTKADQLDPTVELLNYYLGLSYYNSGNAIKACEHWRIGQKLNEEKSAKKLTEICK
ncbi:tetratricopeptide repeat protein [Emticicia sp. 17c]|uniref:tetratricopeptide repeat protein n=1 Tax=Emticicia sp. 17c TaxID=3127704 RepID=UPI00301B9E6A